MRNIEELSAYDYGYGVYTDKLVELFKSGEPDWETAHELIRLGADLNAIGKDEEENALSEILMGYWSSVSWNDYDDDDENENCNNENAFVKDFNFGEAMLQIIQFFLDNGFDVNKKDGRYGAQCLNALTLSTFDKHIIEATKMLFNAGAKNINTSDEEDSTPLSFISMEWGAQGAIHGDYATENIYGAVYQIYKAIENGREYDGIDSYLASYGKEIRCILAEKTDDTEIFFALNLPECTQEHCFKRTLYFIFDDSVLIMDKYTDCWVDKVMPDVATIDVSEHFPGIVGGKIQSYQFGFREFCNQQNPITIIEMDNGHNLVLSINYGEVYEQYWAAFFNIT